jgi:non-ribosomal peptide synthetase component F
VRKGQWDAEEICGLIRTHKINVLGFTPSYGSQLAQFLSTQNEILPVRMIITGGEALTGEHLQRIRAAFKPAMFFNAYGPTETVVMPWPVWRQKCWKRAPAVCRSAA